MTTNLENLQQKLGYTFNNIELLIQALTHQSYANDMDTTSYERLEFLGDSVIQVVVSDYIFNNIIVDAGTSTKLRASLVSTNYLSEVSINLGLDKIALKSKSLQQLGKKNIADLFESVVGAIYTDGGLEVAREIIHKFVIISEENVGKVIKNNVDHKTMIQEYMQAESKEFEYKLLDSFGPDHKREFKVGLIVEGVCAAVAIATSIRLAEEKCAEIYLNTLKEN